jgi:hypothetical protein
MSVDHKLYFAISVSDKSQNFRDSRRFTIFSEKRYRIILEGFPHINAYGGTSVVTTEPAPRTAPFPIVIPPIRIHFDPIHTSLPISI